MATRIKHGKINIWKAKGVRFELNRSRVGRVLRTNGLYFSANEITEAKQKKSILLASVGNDTFKLIRNLIGKEQLKAETTTLDVIVQRVKNHLAPRPNYIFARSDFFDCVRKPGQSVAEFIVVLRKLSEHCKFTNLDEMLRDKLVNSLKDMQTQRRFFEISEEKLTLEKAEQIALAVEKANKNAKSLNHAGIGYRVPGS